MSLFEYFFVTKPVNQKTDIEIFYTMDPMKIVFKNLGEITLSEN